MLLISRSLRGVYASLSAKRLFVFTILVCVVVCCFKFTGSFLVSLRDSADLGSMSASSTSSSQGRTIITTTEVQRGDTLVRIMHRFGVDKGDSIKIAKLWRAKKAGFLQVGQQVLFEHEHQTPEATQSSSTKKTNLRKLSVVLDGARTLEFVLGNGGVKVEYSSTPPNKVMVKYRLPMNDGVIGSLKKCGISDLELSQLIEAYNSCGVDFQKQQKLGGTIVVLAEKLRTKELDSVGHEGRIVYSSLSLDSGNYEIFRYPSITSGFKGKFFDESGRLLQKSSSSGFVKPLSKFRISGHYGYRKVHPVLGRPAMHQGVDLAAPIGTLVSSVSAGIIEHAGWGDGYGNYVSIRHSGNISTKYAHLSKIAKGIAKGSKVQQGQAIGYVGVSGRTTGPHLHFEVSVNGIPVDPIKFEQRRTVRLSKSDLNGFKQFKGKIMLLSQKLDFAVPLVANG